eukprot:6182577-Pleurochrysis_carterae.AAC.2
MDYAECSYGTSAALWALRKAGVACSLGSFPSAPAPARSCGGALVAISADVTALWLEIELPPAHH